MVAAILCFIIAAIAFASFLRGLFNGNYARSILWLLVFCVAGTYIPVALGSIQTLTS